MASFKEIAGDSKASQGAEEMQWLLEQVATIKPKVVVEIGVHLGHSLKAWQDAFHPELLIGIDNERNETLDQYLENGELQAAFLEADSHNPLTAETLVSHYLKGRFIDFLFIDGDHSYEGVTKDFEMYGPLVREGGIVAFHDASIKDHPLVEVYKLMDKLKTLRRKILIKQIDANGTGVLYV